MRFDTVYGGSLAAMRAAGALLAEAASGGRWPLLAALTLSAVAAVAEGSAIWLLATLLGRLTLSTPAPMPFAGVLGLYLGIVVLAVLASTGRTILGQKLRLEMVDRLRLRLHAGVLGMRWPALRSIDVPETLQLATGEAGRIGLGLEFLMQVAAWGARLPILAAVVVAMSPVLALATLLPAVGLLLLAGRLDGRTRRQAAGLMTANRRLMAALEDDLRARRLVKSLCVEAERRRRVAQLVAATRRQVMALQVDGSLQRGALQLAVAVASVVALLIAVQGFDMPLAAAVVEVLAMARLCQSILNLRDGWRGVLTALPAHGRFMARLREAEAAVEPAGSVAAVPTLRRDLTLRHVRLYHPDGGAHLLDDITANLPVGGLTAVVGPSGAGKSTLVDLLLGLTQADEGAVLADGVPFDVDRGRAWRTGVGYVSQNAMLFHDSIRANLLVACAEADETALWRALGDAGAADFVRALPEGLETEVADEGLSGGERQRLALARALLTRPRLLLLDEPTAALDVEAEQAFATVIAGLRGRTTIVMVTHRPALARTADHVLALDRGKLVAEGRPEEVLPKASPLSRVRRACSAVAAGLPRQPEPEHQT